MGRKFDTHHDNSPVQQSTGFQAISCGRIPRLTQARIMSAVSRSIDRSMPALKQKQKHGKKWAAIARDAIPYRGREALRARWALLQVS